MPTKVLVFESDATFAAELKAELARFGCHTTIVDDAGVGLQTAARDKPDLILLAIELPRMNGFSVCNKLKRDPGLRDVPLIIMSIDSSEETFEQHRRLRTRAEDYVRKPIAWPDLLQHIRAFVQLPSSGGQELELEDDETLVVEDDLEIEEEAGTLEFEDPGEVQIDETGAFEAQATGPVEIAEAELELEAEEQADRAFDSIMQYARPADGDPDGLMIEEAEVFPEEILPQQDAGPEQGLGGSPVHYATPDSIGHLPSLNGEDLAGLDEFVAAEPTPASGRPPVSEVAPTTERGGVAAPVAAMTASFAFEDAAQPSSGPPPTAFRSSEPGAGPSSEAPISSSSFQPPRRSMGFARTSSGPPRAAEIEAQRLREELERHRARSAQLEDEVRTSQQRISELEDAVRRGASKDHEVQRLQRDLDDVKGKLAASGRTGSSAREFLDLREQLNRKDKELLDLRDQLTHRDKELLGVRDGALNLERERADLLDQTTELERQLSELSRTSEAFRNDKEAASKRADDFKRKADKLRVDLDARLAELTEVKSQYDAELVSRGAREAEFDARAQADLEQAVLATEASERERAEQSLAAFRLEAENEREALLQAQRTSAAAEAAEALARRQAELTGEYETRIAALQRDSEQTVAQLRGEHASAVSDAERRASERLAEREAELEQIRQRDLEAQRQQHAARLNEVETTHATRNLELETSNAARVFELETAHASRVIELESRLAGRVAELE
ncbi:MAG TPA: response regulator, partial [Polyangiaceae bacterium]|nr:response regulator [Polyangiaceae bacterium]